MYNKKIKGKKCKKNKKLNQNSVYLFTLRVQIDMNLMYKLTANIWGVIEYI